MTNFANCTRCGAFHMMGGTCPPRSPLMATITRFGRPEPVPATNVLSMESHREAVCVKRAAAREHQRDTDLMVARCMATPAGKDFLAYAASKPYGAQLKTDVSERVARCEKFWNTKPSEEDR